jgi:hypothetical protein
MRVEDLNRQPIPIPIQYLQSGGVNKGGSEGVKMTSYFFPSMVFPEQVELVSATLLNGKSNEDKMIVLSTVQPGGTDVPVTLGAEYNVIQKAGQVIAKNIFPRPLILEPLQPFYFFHPNGQLQDSSLVIGYRRCNLNYGSTSPS